MLALFTLSFVVLLLLVFLGGLLHKLFDVAEFQGFVADYQVLPEFLVRPFAILLIGLEASVVLLVLWHATRPLALLLVIALLATYAGAIAINLKRGRTRVECGCGGAPQMLNIQLVWRNLILIVLAVVALTHLPNSLNAVELTMALIAGFFLWIMYRFFDLSSANWQAYKLASRPAGHL